MKEKRTFSSFSAVLLVINSQHCSTPEIKLNAPWPELSSWGDGAKRGGEIEWPPRNGVSWMVALKTGSVQQLGQPSSGFSSVSFHTYLVTSTSVGGVHTVFICLRPSSSSSKKKKKVLSALPQIWSSHLPCLLHVIHYSVEVHDLTTPFYSELCFCFTSETFRIAVPFEFWSEA